MNEIFGIRFKGISDVWIDENGDRQIGYRIISCSPNLTNVQVAQYQPVDGEQLSRGIELQQAVVVVS